MFTVLCATDENNAFGKSNGLPWNCKQDLEFFKSMTVGHCVVMGRATWESVPQKVFAKTRQCIVVSSTLVHTEYARVVRSLREALNIAPNTLHIFLIGGKQLITHALDEHLVQDAYITTIYGKHHCDISFDIHAQLCKQFTRQEHAVYNDCIVHHWK